MSQTDSDAFDVDDFMTAVSQMVEAKIEECVDNFKKGLLKKKNPDLTEETLREVHTIMIYFIDLIFTMISFLRSSTYLLYEIVVSFSSTMLSLASSFSNLNRTYFPCILTIQHCTQPCKKLRECMREEFGKNLNKFELYSRRNIFVESAGEEDSHEQIEMDKEIQEIKDQAAKLADLRRKYAEMSNEYREAEQMLADMKSSLFGIYSSFLLYHWFCQ